MSKELAETIRNWLPSALQYVKPYFTPADIEKGSKWATEIFKELTASSICIIVLTRDNLASNWIMFEAGAISSTIDRAKVCPMIFDLEETDLQGPLAQFQATKFIKQDIRKLFFTINSAAADQKLSDSVADAVFDKWWPDLESQIGKVLSSHKATQSPHDVRSERDLIEELLLLTRKLSADTEKKTAPEKNKASTPALPPIRYDLSTYKKILNLAKLIFDKGAFDNESLLELQQAVDALAANLSKQPLNPVLKLGLTEDLGTLSAEIAKYLKDEAEPESTT